MVAVHQRADPALRPRGCSRETLPLRIRTIRDECCAFRLLTSCAGWSRRCAASTTTGATAASTSSTPTRAGPGTAATASTAAGILLNRWRPGLCGDDLLTELRQHRCGAT